MQKLHFIGKSASSVTTDKTEGKRDSARHRWDWETHDLLKLLDRRSNPTELRRLGERQLIKNEAKCITLPSMKMSEDILTKILIFHTAERIFMPQDSTLTSKVQDRLGQWPCTVGSIKQ